MVCPIPGVQTPDLPFQLYVFCTWHKANILNRKTKAKARKHKAKSSVKANARPKELLW